MALPDTPPPEFRSYLGEGMHTAFRKGADHPAAVRIWDEIDHMPRADWHGIVTFLADGMWPMVLDYARPAGPSPEAHDA